LNFSGAIVLDDFAQKPCTSTLRLVSAKAEQAIVNGHETTKLACFVDKKSNICSFCKCISQNAFVQWTLYSQQTKIIKAGGPS